MVKFSGWQYLLIDVANAFGLDKQLFEERIKWAEDNLSDLEALAGQAESKALFVKATLAIRKAQAGMPTGHLVGLDACCSGMQVMSALTGCIAGATATGLIDPTVRADAYASVTEAMNEILGGMTPVPRKNAKTAVMTSLYGSKAEPKKLFGKDTPEIAAFYEAMGRVCPGAWILLQDLLASWRPGALVHSWKLPDGFDARVKVMTKKEARIEVDELDHATFTYVFYENEGTEKGLSNAANVVHSVDAYVLRSIQRRCNYDKVNTTRVFSHLADELMARDMGHSPSVNPLISEKLAYYITQYERSGMADVVIFNHINSLNIGALSTEHIRNLHKISMSMLEHEPFPVITVHDEFKCHANNMNHLRQHYINIFAEIADSSLLCDLMSQLYQRQCPNVKLMPNLGALIRNSNYALS